MIWLRASGPLDAHLVADAGEFGVDTRIFPSHALDIARLRRALVGFAAGRERARLVFWPHESLYFLPLHLLPVRGGILAEHLTVTVVPSMECLFRQPVTGPTARSRPGDRLRHRRSRGRAAGRAVFFPELYRCLAGGHTRVDAFRSAQIQARARHPDHRDWGAFTYFGG